MSCNCREWEERCESFDIEKFRYCPWCGRRLKTSLDLSPSNNLAYFLGIMNGAKGGVNSNNFVHFYNNDRPLIDLVHKIAKDIGLRFYLSKKKNLYLLTCYDRKFVNFCNTLMLEDLLTNKKMIIAFIQGVYDSGKVVRMGNGRRKAIADVLFECEGKVAKAAKKLSMGYYTLKKALKTRDELKIRSHSANGLLTVESFLKKNCNITCDVVRLDFKKTQYDLCIHSEGRFLEVIGREG